MSSNLARRWWPLAAGVLAGIVVAMLVSLLGSTSRKAEAKVLITSPAGTAAVRPLLGNLRELATSGVVAGNVKSTLRLPESAESLRRHLDASVRPGSEVIAITATDASADRARQLAQEAAVVFGQLVEARFGTSTPELHAAGLDSAHVLAGPDRRFLRNGLIGALVGLLLGAALMFVLAASAARQVTASVVDDLGKREDLVEQRVEGVTARERALADRAGKLAAREQELDERAAALAAAEREVRSRAGELASSERKLTGRAADLAMSKRELEVLAAARPPVPEPVAVPQVEAEPAPAPPTGTWNLNELQAAVDAYAHPTPEQAENWRTYLYFVREHASPDGTLPRSLDPLIADVFAEILHRRAPS